MNKNEIIKETRVNNKNISLTFEKSYLIIKLVYEINKRKYIKLLGYNFFKQNKRKLRIIINNKLCNFSNNYIKVSNNNMEFLKIKLLIMNSPEINFSEMFYNCFALKIFSIITKNEPKLEKE